MKKKNKFWKNSNSLNSPTIKQRNEGKICKGFSNRINSISDNKKSSSSIPSKYETILNIGQKEQDGFASRTFRFQGLDNEIPGPGSYTPPISSPKSKKKKKKSSSSSSSLLPTTSSQFNQNLISTKNVNNPSFSTKGFGNLASNNKRWYEQPPPLYNYPGPGSYNSPSFVEDNLNKNKKSIEYGSSQFALPSNERITNKPKKKILSFKNTPGPGSYNNHLIKTLKPKNPYQSSSVFKSTSNRYQKFGYPKEINNQKKVNRKVLPFARSLLQFSPNTPNIGTINTSRSIPNPGTNFINLNVATKFKRPQPNENLNDNNNNFNNLSISGTRNTFSSQTNNSYFSNKSNKNKNGNKNGKHFKPLNGIRPPSPADSEITTYSNSRDIAFNLTEDNSFKHKKKDKNLPSFFFRSKTKRLDDSYSSSLINQFSNNNNNNNKTTHNTPSFSLLQSSKNSPGPGHYNYETIGNINNQKKNKQKMMSIFANGSKLDRYGKPLKPIIERIQNPGPGSYKILDLDDKKRKKKKKISSSFFVSSSNRFSNLPKNALSNPNSTKYTPKMSYYQKKSHHVNTENLFVI